MATRIENMTLEERVFDLLYPYRKECFESTVAEEKLEQISVSDKQERKACTIAHNLAFMIADHRFKTEKARRNKIESAPKILPNDVFLVVTDCNAGANAEELGRVDVLVRYPAAMQLVVRAKLFPGDGVIDKLHARVEKGVRANGK